VNCAICGVRKPKRYCPGVRGEICSICCGTEREQSVDCPLECEYLHEAHLHEKPPKLDPTTMPNMDVRVNDSFLEENEPILILVGNAVLEGALKTPGITDFDIREALEALIQTYRALQSGLYYEAMPQNPYAAAIHESVQDRVADLRKRETEATKLATTISDAKVLGILVFLQRLEYANNIGRKRSRAFLDFLTRFYVPPALAPEAAPEPDAPRVIL